MVRKLKSPPVEYCLVLPSSPDVLKQMHPDLYHHAKVDGCFVPSRLPSDLLVQVDSSYSCRGDGSSLQMQRMNQPSQDMSQVLQGLVQMQRAQFQMLQCALMPPEDQGDIPLQFSGIPSRKRCLDVLSERPQYQLQRRRAQTFQEDVVEPGTAKADAPTIPIPDKADAPTIPGHVKANAPTIPGPAEASSQLQQQTQSFSASSQLQQQTQPPSQLQHEATAPSQTVAPPPGTAATTQPTAEELLDALVAREAAKAAQKKKDNAAAKEIAKAAKEIAKTEVAATGKR
jgi:hypothetical protein